MLIVNMLIKLCILFSSYSEDQQLIRRFIVRAQMQVCGAMLGEEHDPATNRKKVVRLAHPDVIKCTQSAHLQHLINRLDPRAKQFIEAFTSGYISNMCVDTLNTIAAAKNWNGHAAAAGCAAANFASLLIDADALDNPNRNFRVQGLHTFSLCGSPRGHHDNFYSEYMCAAKTKTDPSFLQSAQFESDKDLIIEAFDRGEKNPSVSNTVDWVTKFRGMHMMYGDGKSYGGPTEGLDLLNVLATRIFGHSDTAVTMHSNDTRFTVTRLSYTDCTWEVMEDNVKQLKTGPYVRGKCSQSEPFNVKSTDSAVCEYDAVPLPPGNDDHPFNEEDKATWLELSTQVRKYLAAFWETMDILERLFEEQTLNIDQSYDKWVNQWADIEPPHYEPQAAEAVRLAGQDRWIYGPGWHDYNAGEKAEIARFEATVAARSRNSSQESGGTRSFSLSYSEDSDQPLEGAVARAVTVVKQHGIQTDAFRVFLDLCEQPTAESGILKDILRACMNESENSEVYEAFAAINDVVRTKLDEGN